MAGWEGMITYVITEIAENCGEIEEYSEPVLLCLGKNIVSWASKLQNYRDKGRRVACKIE